MMANFSFRILLAHWVAFLDALQQFFSNYTPRPLLSTVFPELIEGSSKFSPIVHVPRIRDPSDYSNSVDLATICLVPTILQTPLAMNLSYSVDRPDYNLGDASSLESSDYYVFLDIPAWGPAIPHEDMPPVSPSARVADDHTQTSMAPYGARGFSFCPVLVGIVYIQSLLHLYMLLMIPTLFIHWFEEVWVYESLNPIELLDCSWFLHTSLWMAPWHLLRYGVREAVPCLYRHFRRVSYKSTHPPIPRIVLIRVDGEAVPVSFVEDHQVSGDVGVWSSLESEDLEMRDSWDATSVGGEPQDFMQSLVSDGESCVATEFGAPPMRTISYQGRIAKAHDGIRLESLTSEVAEGSQPFVNKIRDEHLENSPVLVETTSEPLQSVKKETPILSIPGPETVVAMPSDRNADERTDELEQMAFLEVVVDDVRQDDANRFWERENSDQDIAFSPWSLINDYGPDESETPSETVSMTGSSKGLQDTPTPAKNVRFAIGDDAGAADRWQVSLSDSRIDEYTYAWDLGSQRGDDGVTPVQIPVVPFDPSMDKQDAIKPVQANKPVLPVVLSEERAEENIPAFAESLSPSLAGKPVVNLPALVAIREDIRFVEMDSMIPAALIEDVATRSPFQTFSPIAPAVVINMSRIIEVEEEQSLTPLGTEDLDLGLTHAGHVFDCVGTLNDKAAACETLDIVPPCEDKSCPPSSSIEDSNPVHSPMADSESPLGDVRTMEIALSASAAVSEIGMPVANTNLVVTNTSPSAAMEVPGTNELGAEVLYETPRYYSDGKDLARSLRNGLQGPEVSVPDATSTRMHLPAVSESPKEPGMEDQVNFAAVEKSDSMTITLSGRPVSLSGALATELPTTKPSERLLVLPDTCNEASPLSIASAEKKTGQLDHGKSREAYTIPWDHPSTISKSPPDRTLSGSMHAPSESLLIPQTNSHIDRASVLYETPPFMAHSVSLARPNEGKGGTSMIIENTSERKQDLSASIHAPQRISKPGVQSSVSQLRCKSKRDHRRSLTNPVVVSESTPVTKPCPPNWTAMPEVVDAFRLFKQAPSGNTIRRVSSISERTNRGPMLGVVSQKGFATNSLNNASATADIQSRWMHRSGLLLIRDFVSSDPADFNLRTCTNLKASKVHGMNAIPVQQALYPGMLDISSYALQSGITRPVLVNADFSSMVGGSPGIQRQQSMLVPHKAEIGPTLGSQRWMAYRG